MSYYYKYLFEDFTPKQPTKQTIYLLIEGYNPDLVKKIAGKFMNYAEADGFEIPEESIIQSNQSSRKLYSCYFNCENQDNKWKIRVADHPHNDNYDNSSNYQIIVNDEEITNLNYEEYTHKKYKHFRKITHRSINNKEYVLDKINNSNLCRRFLLNYKSNPKWFPQLLQKYDIKEDIKNYDWFKIAFQNKCTEIVKREPVLQRKYSQTFIYDWKPGERLNHF